MNPPKWGQLEAALIAALQTFVEGHPAAEALFLGGSIATGRFDEHSDIDLKIVVKKGTVRPVFAAMDRLLKTSFRVTNDFCLEGQGSLQANFNVAQDSHQRILDLFLFDGRIEPQNRDLHGDIEVLVDKGAVVRTFVPTEEQVQDKARSYFRMLRNLAFMGKEHTFKELKRGRATDAHYYYQRNLGRMIEAGRLLHCPRKLGLGVRYASVDLPRELGREIERLLLPRDLEELERFDREVTKRTEDLLRSYAERGKAKDSSSTGISHSLKGNEHEQA